MLTVTKPDRLARSTAELLSIEADLSKRGIGLVVLSMGGERLDTRNPTSKLMLTILAGVATWEREIMLERQREGIAKAKAAGKYKGRPISIDAAQIRQLRAELGPAAIAKRWHRPEFGLPRARTASGDLIDACAGLAMRRRRGHRATIDLNIGGYWRSGVLRNGRSPAE